MENDNCPYQCMNANGVYKRGYSKRGVKRVIKDMQTHVGGAMGSYHCPCCGRWHLQTIRRGGNV